MKKLLVAFNGATYSKELSSFALEIAGKSNSLIHGVFLSPTLLPVAQYPFPNDLPLTSLVTTEEMLHEQQQVLDANIQVFEDDCKVKNIAYTVERDPNITLEELIDQSAFADIILCLAKEEMGGVSIRELLADTHCPVLLVPQNASLPDRVILCYDESFSSILAMKMFAYLFPEWKDLPASVITINPKEEGRLKYEDYLGDWLPQHFTRIDRQILKGNPNRELINFIRKGEGTPMVIMGAYGRNAISRLFHRSLANVLIEETNASLFVIHE